MDKDWDVHLETELKRINSSIPMNGTFVLEKYQVDVRDGYLDRWKLTYVEGDKETMVQDVLDPSDMMSILHAFPQVYHSIYHVLDDYDETKSQEEEEHQKILKNKYDDFFEMIEEAFEMGKDGSGLGTLEGADILSEMLISYGRFRELQGVINTMNLLNQPIPNSVSEKYEKLKEEAKNFNRDS